MTALQPLMQIPNSAPGTMTRAFRHDRMPKELTNPASPPTALTKRRQRYETNTMVARSPLLLSWFTISSHKTAEITTAAC